MTGLGLGVWGAADASRPGSWWLVLGGVAYVVGMFVCTVTRNVPLNRALDRVEPDDASAGDLWSHYVRVWTRWNHVRTVCSLAAAWAFCHAAWIMR